MNASPEGPPTSGFKPKKSVALSGVTAGNTALCTVGRSGNDLHYRGYDILEVAETCEFEELAYLLIHGKLPNAAELAGYKARLKSLRGLPGPLRSVLEQLPASTHPMDVLRTGASMLGCLLPEREAHDSAGVDIVLHCCSAYRAMNLAALKVYQAIRRDGTQKNVVADMQTRDDLYKYLDYHAYEHKLDALFSKDKEKPR